MEFYKHLKETGDSLKYKEENPHQRTWRMFAHLPIDEHLKMSVQASAAHYCTPRTTIDFSFKTIENLYNYTHMEFALIDSTGEFVRVQDVSPDFHCLAEIESYSDGGQVYAYVPVDLIDELFQHLVLKRDERTYD